MAAQCQVLKAMRRPSKVGHAHEARDRSTENKAGSRISLVLEHVLIKQRFVVDANQGEIDSHYLSDLPPSLPASFSLFSRLRFTSQLYSRAVFTSIIVSCSLKNSRSSIVLFKLDCATSSLDVKRVIAAGNLYDSMTFACAWLRVSRGINGILTNVPQAIDKLYRYPRAQLRRKVCR